VVVLGDPKAYARIPICYWGVGERGCACSPNRREEFFSETRRTEGSNLPHTYSDGWISRLILGYRSGA